MKNLFLLRGLPGSGKSTVAKYLVGSMSACGDSEEICADDCWEVPYTKETFTNEKHAQAHGICLMIVKGWMITNRSSIFVHNTFTTESEMQPYFDLAKKYGYQVFALIVENRHGSESIHDVPGETIELMRNRFSIKL